MLQENTTAQRYVKIQLAVINVAAQKDKSCTQMEETVNVRNIIILKIIFVLLSNLYVYLCLNVS